MAAARGATAQVGPVSVSNAHKVWWPDEGITKLDVVRHYAAAAPRLLPFTDDRPLSTERCPDGMRGHCFYQKSFPDGAKWGVPTRPVFAASVRHTVHYAVGNDVRTLLALANLGALTFHLMNCRAATPRQPDWLAFDLDPARDVAESVRAALVLREVLDALRLRGYPKTTGGKGIHVLIPLAPGPSHDDVMAAARAIGERMVARAPDLLTLEFYKKDRGGRVYIDIQRNVFGQTIVAPYAVRRRPRAPVSTPLTWDEVRADLDPAAFNVRTIGARLDARDPWARFWSDRQKLPTLRSASAAGSTGRRGRATRGTGRSRPASAA